MKKYFILFLSVLIVGSFSVDLAGEKKSIELRAFKEGKFISDFSEKDFEIFYDGSKKDIKSISIVKKNKASKVFGKKIKDKGLSRNFVLMFSLRNFSPKIFSTIDHFFQNVILPGDSLTVFTPKKNYNLKSSVLEKMPKQKIAAQLKGILKRDIMASSQRYNSLMDDLIKINKELSITSGGRSEPSSVEMALPRFRENLIALENLRRVHQKQVIDLIFGVGKRSGQNLVYFFYDREFIPSPTNQDIRVFKDAYNGTGRQDIISSISSLFEFYKRDSVFEAKKIKEKFKKLNLIINPILFKEDSISKSDTNLVEHSEDMFELLTLLSKLTGGKMDTSSNLLASFKRAIEYTEDFFRVSFQMDKSSKNERKLIEIKPKDSKIKIFYRFTNI